MKYRRFGRTDMLVSEIGLGGGYITGKGNDAPDEKAIAIVRRALELGCNYIDTAPYYGRYRSETCIGLALEGWDRPCYIATKVGVYPPEFDYTRDAVLRSFEGSLRRLRREQIDLLQIHQCELAGWEKIMGPGGTLEGLRELQRQGLVRYIGVTGYDLDLLIRLVETDIFDAVLNYNRYDLLVQEAKWRLLPVVEEHHVAYVAGSPLHSGLLGARRQSRLEQMAQRGGDVQAVERRLAYLEKTLSGYADSLPRMALRYLLADPRVAVVIPSASRIEQVEENMGASEAGPLPAELVSAIEKEPLV